MRPRCHVPLLLAVAGCAPVDTGPRFDFPMCVDEATDVVFEVTPTWSEDVAPIVMAHCAACHRDGGSAPMSLATLEAATPWGPAMVAAMAARTMPPPGPTGCGDCNRYRNAPWVPAADIARVRAWVDGGMPAGDPEVVPALPPLPAGLDRVDQAVQMAEPYTPKGDGADDYRCFVVMPEHAEDVFLTGFDVLPGDPTMVHHVILYTLGSDAAADQARALDAAEDGQGYTCFGGTGVAASNFTVGWAPGLPATTFPEGTGVRIPAGRPMVLQLHYNLADGVRADQSTVHLRTEPDVAVEAAIETYAHTGFRLPPGEAYVQAERYFPVARPGYPGTITVWGIAPHLHTLGRTLSVEIWNDTEHQCVVDVATWDFDAQGLYFFEEPLVVRGDDQMRLTCGWDTRQADGPVTWGEGTADEMCVAIVYGSPGLPADAQP